MRAVREAQQAARDIKAERQNRTRARQCAQRGADALLCYATGYRTSPSRHVVVSRWVPSPSPPPAQLARVPRHCIAAHSSPRQRWKDITESMDHSRPEEYQYDVL